jgi:hypothetical protein
MLTENVRERPGHAFELRVIQMERHSIYYFTVSLTMPQLGPTSAGGSILYKALGPVCAVP